MYGVRNIGKSKDLRMIEINLKREEKKSIGKRSEEWRIKFKEKKNILGRGHVREENGRLKIDRKKNPIKKLVILKVGKKGKKSIVKFLCVEKNIIRTVITQHWKGYL